MTTPTQGEHAQPEALRQILLDPENQPNQYGVQFLMHGPKMAFKIGARQFTLDYEPDEPGEFEFMRDALIDAFSVFTPDVKSAQTAAPQGGAYAELPDVDALAQEIRRVDGAHKLGAGALAEALMPFLRASHGQAPATNPWREAVVNACMPTEACFDGGNPTATIKNLIGWHLETAAQRAPAPTPQADSQPAPDVDLIARGMRWEECEALMKEACAQAGVQWDEEKEPQSIAINVMQRLANAAHKVGFKLGLERTAAARAPADSGATPAQQVVVDFAQVGTAGPFAVVDGRVSLPDATMQDLVHMLRPTFNAQAADSVLEDAALSQAARDVLAERQRQVKKEGWTRAHDDEHADGSLAAAAACYAIVSVPSRRGDVPVSLWPKSWSPSWWKPSTPRRNLIKAGALILAELERIDRAARKQGTNHD